MRTYTRIKWRTRKTHLSRYRINKRNIDRHQNQLVDRHDLPGPVISKQLIQMSSMWLVEMDISANHTDHDSVYIAHVAPVLSDNAIFSSTFKTSSFSKEARQGYMFEKGMLRSRDYL